MDRIDARKLSKDEQRQLRLTIMKGLDSGKTVTQIAREMRYNRRHIYNCISKKKAGYLTVDRRGRPKKAQLNQNQLNSLLYTIFKNRPETLGPESMREYKLWSLEAIQKYCQIHCQVDMSKQEINRLLSEDGIFNFIKIDHSRFERNDKFQEMYPRLRRRASYEKALIFWVKQYRMKGAWEEGFDCASYKSYLRYISDKQVIGETYRCFREYMLFTANDKRGKFYFGVYKTSSAIKAFKQFTNSLYDIYIQGHSSNKKKLMLIADYESLFYISKQDYYNGDLDKYTSQGEELMSANSRFSNWLDSSRNVDNETGKQKIEIVEAYLH